METVPSSTELILTARVALQDGDSRRALGLLRQAAELSPDLPEPSLQLVNLLRRLGEPREAAQAGIRFLEGNPDHAQMHLLVGVCHAELLDFVAAEAHFRRAVQLEPGSPRHLVHHAKALRILGFRLEALETLGSARKIAPNAPGLQLMLGETLVELGRFEEAIAAFDQAIADQTTGAAPYLARATARRVTERDAPFVEQVRRLLALADLDPRNRSTLSYALAKALDDLGDYGSALAFTDQAVRLVATDPGKARVNASVEAETFDQPFFDRASPFACDSERPVFIVGAPRSGTTLLDQILTSHPQIGGAGEMLFWLQHAAEATTALREHSAFASKICKTYLALLERQAPDKARVTDKMPTNFRCLGPIHALLPKARIVHCHRHPVDTCLSLYLNGHSISPKPFGETREEIVAGYRDYLRLMEHWRRTLPGEVFFEVGYEDLVKDREGVSRRLLEFLGLPWDPACLHHEANPRDVATPSRWQARQPIYAGSVERWRRYEPWLGAFKDLL